MRFLLVKSIFFSFLCVNYSECCQNTGDLRLILSLNTSCVGTDWGLKLLRYYCIKLLSLHSLCRRCVRAVDGKRLRVGGHSGSSDTHWVVITLEDDACWVSGCRTTQVSVLVHDADGAVIRRLRAGLDVSQVVALSINHPTRTQRTHWREQFLDNSPLILIADFVIW